MTAEIWDVIVVGAGLSGLSAAHLLQKKKAGMRILILEAKDRVGGRTLTAEIPAANGIDHWDLGGQWVGSTQTHVLELIEELGLETYSQYNTGKKVHHMGGPGGKVRTYSSSIPSLSLWVLLDLLQFLWKVDRLCATVCVRDPFSTPRAAELDSMTLHSYIEQHAWTGELKEELGMGCRSVFGIEPAQMSFLFFLVYCTAGGGLLPLLESTPGSAQELKIKGGTQQLSERLAKLLGWKNVQLGSAVKAIWQDAEWARVMTATNTFLCRAVIVTCPPHLAAKIQYQPALPSQREFLTQNMPVGHMIKFIITYQTAFWKERGFSGEIVVGSSTDCPFCVTFDATSPNGNAALVGFFAGELATQWTSREGGERRKAVVSSLVKYLGPEAASFIHYEEKDWAKEEYSGGCPVNVMAPGLLTYYHPSLRKPFGRVIILPSLSGQGCELFTNGYLREREEKTCKEKEESREELLRIHWAGTETATQWCGYMSGAIQSGQRAALEVLAEVCPMVLTQEEQEEARLSQTVKGPFQKTQSSRLMFLTGSKAMVIAILTIGTALLLARHPTPIQKVKACLTDVFLTAKNQIFS